MDTDIDFAFDDVYKIRSVQIKYTNPIYNETNIQERFINNNNTYDYLFNKCCFCFCIVPFILFIYFLLIYWNVIINKSFS